MLQTVAYCLSHPVIPIAVLYALAVAFIAFTVLYIYRIMFPEGVKAAYGYVDQEDDGGHVLGMFGMVPMLVPALLAISPNVMGWVLLVGGGWFLVRYYWRYKLPHVGWWWDPSHITMFSAMGAMYFGIRWMPVLVLSCAYWTWLTCYYTNILIKDIKNGKPLVKTLSSIAHLTMGVTMDCMTFWPDVFMGQMIMS